MTAGEINLQRIAEKLGLRKEGSKYYCPQHDDETPDLNITKDKFGCFNHKGVEGGYKAVSVVMHTQNWSKQKALNWLKENSSLNPGNGEEINPEPEKALNKATELAVKALKNSEHLDSLCEKREFSEEDILNQGIGLFTDEVADKLEEEFKEETLEKSGLKTDGFFSLKGRMLIPFQNAGQTRYFIGRQIDGDGPKYKKLPMAEQNEDILYTLLQNSDKLIITEGNFDALSAYKSEYDAVAAITNKIPEKHEEEVVRLSKTYDEVFLAFDQDDAGKKGTEAAAELLLNNGISPKIIELTEGQDLDDYTALNGYDLSLLEENASSFIDRLIEEANQAEDRGKKQILSEKVLRLVQDHPPSLVDQILTDLPISKKALQKELKQIREKTAKESSSKISTDLEEPEESPFKELEIGESTLELVPSVEIEILSHEYSLNKLSSVESQAVSAQNAFKIYSFSFGGGTKDEDYYLFAEPDQRIVLGEKNLPLKPIDLDRNIYREPLYQKFQILKQRGEVEGGFEEFKDQFRPAFTTAQELTKNSIEKVKNLENEVIRGAVEEYLDNGYDIDPAIKNANYPKLIIHDQNKTRPQDVAKYAPHTFEYTNTKTGKSYTGERAGEIRDKVSAAGFLGYGDADGVQKGILDGLALNFFADETTSKSHENNLNDKILSLMEKGEITISQAGRDIKTEFYGSISYLGNPINEGETLSLNDSFVKIIEELGDNVEAMGSRLGLVIIDMNIQEVEGSSLNQERAQKLETFVQWLRKEIAPHYTEIERNLQSWLETSYPQDHLEEIENYRKQLINFKSKDFWKSHKQSYRHARGQALRMAAYKHLGEILKDEHSIEEIQETAERQFEKVMEQNLDSLQNMADLSKHKRQQLRKSQLQGQEPRYLRYLVYSAIFRHQDEPIESVISLNQLKEHWLNNRDQLDVDEDSKYRKWAPIQKSIESNIEKYRGLLRRKYGIWLSHPDDQVMLDLNKPELFEKYAATQSADPEQVPSSPRSRHEQRRAKCGDCGQIQSASKHTTECVSCGSFNLNNITGDEPTPETKDSSNKRL